MSAIAASGPSRAGHLAPLTSRSRPAARRLPVPAARADRGRVVVSLAGSPGGHAVVAGGGPAGSLAATLLAKQGWDVQVLEAREDPAAAAPNVYSYNILLISRGLKALAEAGVRLEDTPQWPECVVSAGNSNKFLSKRKSPFGGEPPVAVNRERLAAAIAWSCRQAYPERVAFTYGVEIEKVDVQGRTVTAGGKDIPYDLLVGADGVRSPVRSALAEQSEGFEFTQNVDMMQYKTVELPPRPEDEELDNYFVTWRNKKSQLLAPPAPRGKRVGVLIMEKDADPSYQKLEGDDDRMLELLKAECPEAWNGDEGLMRLQVERMKLQEPRPGGVTTMCNRLHGPGVALVGDAAHSMWASLGQGCNTALESCSALARCVGSPPADAAEIDRRLERFSEERLEDVRAMAWLSEQGQGGTKERSNSRFFMVATGVLFMLSKLAPFLSFLKPALMSIFDPDVPLAQVGRSARRQTLAVKLAAWGAFLAAAAAVAMKIARAVGVL